MNTKYRWLVISIFLAFQVVAISLAFPSPAYADDCLSDPLNGADCMRTPGFRQGTSVLISLAGAATSAVVSILTGAASAGAAATSTAAGVAADVPVIIPPFGDPNTPEGALSNYGTIMTNAGEILSHMPPSPPEPEPPEPPPSPLDIPQDYTPETGVEGATPTLEPPVPPDSVDTAPEGSSIWDNLGKIFSPDTVPGDKLDGLLPPGILPIPGPLDTMDAILGGLTSIGEKIGAATNIDLPGITNADWFDKMKNVIGSGSTVVGNLKDYITFPDSPETIAKVKDALNAWKNNPTADAAKDYLDQIGKTGDGKFRSLGEGLDKFGKVVDVIEGIGKGLDEANKEGFTGADKGWAVAGELGKKGLTWIITSNPVVGTADWVVGTTSQAIWGKDGRVDIGAGIDKAGDAWKNTVKDYAKNTSGSADSDFKTADDFVKQVRDIKQQVKSGKISSKEGVARAKKMRDILLGGQQ